MRTLINQFTGKPAKGTCDCDLCKRHRWFEKQLKRLPKSERDWVEQIYNALFEAESEADMANAYIAELTKNN